MKDDIDIEEHDLKDEIDIEEHDVLDNPRIRTIFPDLAQIKKEISGDYHDLSTHNVLKEHNYCKVDHDDDDDDCKVTGANLSTHNVLKEHNYCKVTGTSPDSRIEYQPYYISEDARQHDQEDTSEYARFGSKIILGSKPSSTLRISEDIQNGESVLVFRRKSVEIKHEAEEYEETTEEVHHPEDVQEEKYSSVSTVLILGSTPSSSGVIEPLIINDVSHDENELAESRTKYLDQEIDLKCEDNDSDHDIDTNDPKDTTAALVLLENWGPRLQNSSCYCRECLILFPTSNTLLAHNMTTHSLLVAVDKKKVVKSTAGRNVKKVSTDSGKFCNQFDKKNVVFKPQPKKVVPSPSSKTVLPKQLEDDAEFGSVIQVYDQEAVILYKCQVCSIYLEVYGNFVKHMINNHSKTEFSEVKVLFNGTCLLCNTKVKDELNYNKHIKLLHPEVYNFKGPITVPKGQVEKKLVARQNNELAKYKTKVFDQEIDINCEDNDSDHDIDTNDSKNPTAALVLLENWGPRLQNSSCYCKECLILFSTSNTLLAHNMTAHSFLVAVDKNKAVKSTAKPNVKKVSNDSGKFGNHCNVSDGLINYSYEKFTFAKNNAVFKPQPKKVVPNPSSKTLLPKQLEDDAEFGSVMQVYDQEAVDLFQCQVCSYYLEIYRGFVKHMINNHSKTEFSKERVLFNGTCLLCNSKAKNKISYNWHIQQYHTVLYNYKGPLPQAKKPIPKVVPQTQSQKLQCQLTAKDTEENSDEAFTSAMSTENEPHRKCDQCQLLFRSKISLNLHINRHHKLRKLYQCGKCKTCFNHNTNRTFKQHYEACNSIHPNNAKCDQCQLMFLSKMSLIKHINRHHRSDNFEFDVILKNYDEKSAISRVVKTVSSKKPLDKNDDMIIECKNKSANKLTKLYQCGKCKTCFNSSKNIKRHYKFCDSIQPNEECDQCQLKFLSKITLNMHINLHHRSDNFKFHVILVNYDEMSMLSTVVKTVSSKKPLESNKNLSTLDLDLHKAICQQVTNDTAVREQCQFKFSKNGLETHVKKHHKNMQLKIDDFQIVDHVNDDNIDTNDDIDELAAKDTEENSKEVFTSTMRTENEASLFDKDDDTSESKNSNANKNKLYQCGKCKSCFNSSTHIKNHYAECESIQPNRKCDQCQLLFNAHKSLKLHINRHHRSNSFKFHVILVNDDENSAISRIVKTVSSKKPLDKEDDTSEFKNKNANKFKKLYQCGKCKSCFNSSKYIKVHYADCESIKPNKKCGQCQLMFLSKISLKTHINLHHRSDNFKFHVILVNYDENSPKSRRVVKMISSKKPLDKYDETSESKNKTPNKLSKLYQCGKCKTCFTNNQNIKQHYAECESIQPNIKCDQCQLMFTSTQTADTHINRHHKSAYFKFHVILVNYDEKSAISKVVQTVSSNKPLESNKNLSTLDLDLHQAICQQDTNDTSNESTSTNANKSKLYRCSKCKSCLNSNKNFKQHYAECESIQPNEKCDQCQLKFLSKISLTNHINRHHRSDNFKFHVILVDYDETSAISRVVKTVSSKKPLDKDDDTSESKKTNKLSKLKKLSKLYQCGKCKTCFHSNKFIKQHYIECKGIQPIKKCDQCQLLFPLKKTSLNIHINRHHRSDNFKFHVILVNFDEKSAMSQVVQTVSSNISLEITENVSNKLYQCGKCKSCFICNKLIKQHYAECKSIQPKEKCDQCQLKFFSKISLTNHINRHHRSDNFKFHVILVDYEEQSAISRVVTTVSSNKPRDKDVHTSESKISNKLSKLYQCGKCKSCFNSNKNFKQHYAECESIQPKEKCDQCQLKFFAKISLTNHINRHHRSDNFKFHVILVHYDEKSAISRVVKTVSSKKPLDKDDDTSDSKNKNLNKLSRLSKLYQCGKCKYCFNTNKSMKQHYYKECGIQLITN